MRKVAPTLLVVGLLAATATAFAVTERLKLEQSPVIRTRIDHLMSPVCTACLPGAREAKIGFRLRREEDIELDIADSAGIVIRHRVGSGVFPASFRTFAWDGRDDSGRVVADGLYRVDLRLLDEDRTFEFPDEIRVDSTPPAIEDVHVNHTLFSPDGDGRADRVDFRYRFSEPAYAVLYVDGKQRSRGRLLRAGTIQWYALRLGRGLPPGKHRLALAAQDPAGNLAPSTREFTVRIRYVELFRRRYVARGGRRLRLRVSTDATVVRYLLAGRGRRIAGTVRARDGIRSLSLRLPRRPGRYRLTLSANGRTTRATVVVRGPRR